MITSEVQKVDPWEIIKQYSIFPKSWKRLSPVLIIESFSLDFQGYFAIAFLYFLLAVFFPFQKGKEGNLYKCLKEK